jgi:hypothetical protein
LPVGTYTVGGTTSDPDGDTGTFTFTLYVTPGTLSTTPTSDSTNVVSSASYTTSLSTSGNLGGSVTYAQTTGAPNVLVSSSGAIKTGGTLPAGSYLLSGTTTDPDGDTGTWSFTLTVTSSTLTTVPIADSSTVAHSSSYTVTLSTTGNFGGPVTYTESSGSSSVLVSSSGLIDTGGTLVVGTYAVSGTTIDPDGDTGNFTFTLTVTSVSLSTSPFGDFSTVTGSGTYTSTLVTPNATGTVTYTQTTGAPSVMISSSGVVTTSGTLAVGVYSTSGTSVDSYGDSGTWNFTLIVSSAALTTTPTSGTTTVPSSGSYTTNLSTSGNTGTVTYSASVGSSHLLISPSGVVSTSGILPAGTYTVSGPVTDTNGDLGGFSFTLTVTAGLLTTTPSGTSTTVPLSAGFSTSLTTSGNLGGPVTYVTISGPSGLFVSSSGVVTTSGTLAVGSYTVNGTTTDPDGDTGTFIYTLTITAGTLTTTNPTSESTTVPDSSSFTATLSTTGNFGGAVTYVQSTGAPYVLVSSSGLATRRVAPWPLARITWRAPPQTPTATPVTFSGTLTRELRSFTFHHAHQRHHDRCQFRGLHHDARDLEQHRRCYLRAVGRCGQRGWFRRQGRHFRQWHLGRRFLRLPAARRLTPTATPAPSRSPSSLVLPHSPRRPPRTPSLPLPIPRVTPRPWRQSNNTGAVTYAQVGRCGQRGSFRPRALFHDHVAPWPLVPTSPVAPRADLNGDTGTFSFTLIVDVPPRSPPRPPPIRNHGAEFVGLHHDSFDHGQLRRCRYLLKELWFVESAGFVLGRSSHQWHLGRWHPIW